MPFSMFKNFADFGAMLKQAQQLGGQMQEIAAQLRTQRVTGSAGGGLIEVEANGLGEVLRVKIDASLQDREVVEDLLPGAINQAVSKAKEQHIQAMQSMTAGLNLPGLTDALTRLTGAGEG
jgi:DNA-binding YbaB/EbfC family protein